METWPNFFIVGAAKAGTTSLYAYLQDTPGVFMSSEKEPGYFRSNALPAIHDRRVHKKSEYLKLFKGVTDEKAIGEGTPGYLVDPESAKLIHSAVPLAKIIILLRDPVERAFSHYLFRKTKGFVQQTFHEMITSNINSRKKGDAREFNFILDPSLYTKNIKRFQDIFGKDNVKILIFEEFIKEPKRTLKEVLEFLGVKAEPPATIEKTYNVYGAPRGMLSKHILGSDRLVNFSRKIIPQSLRWELRAKVLLKKEEKPKLSSEERAILEDFYSQDSLELEELLQRKLPWPWISHG